MHSRVEWLGKSRELNEMYYKLTSKNLVDGVLVLIIGVLIMLVEDKVKG